MINKESKNKMQKEKKNLINIDFSKEGEKLNR
jgi:hypothetical protein